MANDSWRTPPQVFNTLNAEFNFKFDMACSEDNKLCKAGVTEDMDALSMNWSKEALNIPECIKSTIYLWLNCPYSNPMPWVKKALEAQCNGLGVVMLLNSDDSVGWFAEALKGVSEIRRIIADPAPEGKREYSSGRIDFIDESGKPIKGNNKPQFILVFNPFKIGAAHTTYIRKSELYQ